MIDGSRTKNWRKTQRLAQQIYAGDEQHFASQQSDDATPLDFLISAYRDPSVPIALRIHAAGKAAPFLHRALKSVEHSGEGSGPVRIEIGWERPE